MKSIALFLFFFCIQMLGQAQSIEWAQRIGNVKSDKIISIKTDGIGNVFIAGYFSTSINIGTNSLLLSYVGSVNSKEAFIAKLDSNGFCFWAKAGGQYYDDRVLGMDVDSAGNSVITGTFWEGAGINFPPINVSGNAFGSNDQCFIIKYDPSGNPVWGRFVCGDNVTPSGGNYRDDQGLDIVWDKHGNIYTVGFMTTVTLYCGGNTVTATNPNTGTHKHCYWLTKMNAAGTFQWAKTFGNLPWDPTAGKYIERDIAVCVDDKDGVYVTGGFDGTRQFGGNSFTSLGGYDCFVIKYDSSGNFKWSKQAGSTKDDWSNGICSDKDGHIYITGEHRDSLFYDTMMVKNYDGRDVFVFKIDAQTGNPIWGKRAGGNLGSERGNDIWADENCNVYVCGDINDSAKFGDKILVTNPGMGVQSFLARMTPEGKWTWVVTGGGPGDDDRGNALAKGKNNQVYWAGYFRSAATYGSNNLASAGSSDGYFVRLHDSMLNRGTPFVLNPPNKVILCGGDTAHLSVPDHAHFEINPATGVSFNADSTKLVFSPTSNTNYTLSGFSDSHCPEYDTLGFSVSVGQAPFIIDPPNDSVICEGEIINMNINPHDHFEINPTTGTTINSGQNLLSFSPSFTTSYVLSGYYQGVCASEDTLHLTVLVNPKPLAEFQVTPNVVFIDNPVFTLNNTTTGASNYKWYDQNNLLFSTALSPVVNENSIGTYCYTLIAESDAGCLDTATDCGAVVKHEYVFFPTAFTPNGDNRNDVFKPILVNMDFSIMNDYKFVIVNRFGEIVFNTSTPNEGWDGLWKGSPSEIGSYFYFCNFTTPQGKRYEVKGDVSLVY